MRRKHPKRDFHDVSTVESQRNELIPEEFPEGPYGAAHNEPQLGKSTPWRPGQHAAPQFTYEMREFHEGLPRQAPGSHPTHDEQDRGGDAPSQPTFEA
ncbi:hypothetical protein NWF35_16450 [Polycladomyces subterraneus]|uniref:Cytosolic protein n=1 Tax=Polycladomyces subterraneus TaxID=1016997 RepID=A0ABT8IRS4_9BACL|nr:hypothetical protein [Polycladomyces subterraneus]MDN4595450.1 hypothetical protein [Polycladomyces subterraneus]